MGMRMYIGRDADVIILVVVVVVGLKIPENKYNRKNKMKRNRKKSMGHADSMRTSNMKRATRYFPPGGISDDDNSDDDEVSFSSVIVMIVTFINEYTKILYHYTTLDLPTF